VRGAGPVSGFFALVLILIGIAVARHGRRRTDTKAR